MTARNTLGRLTRTAAIVVACIACGVPGAAQQQEVTVSSPDGRTVVNGEVLGFDGRYLRLMTDHGEVTLDQTAARCAGTACPDPTTWVPTLRLSGSDRLVNLLGQPLVAAYARTNGFDLAVEGAAHRLTRPGESLPFFTLVLQPNSSAEGLADLVANAADMVLSDRPLTAAERRLAQGAGLGALGRGTLDRIIALDAEVPIVAPTRDEREIGLAALDALRTGSVQGPLTLADGSDVVAEVLANPDAIGIVGFGAWGNARPLALTGPCGRPIGATVESLKTGDYPLTRSVFLFRPGRRLSPAAQGFLTWLRSPAAQGVVRRAGLVDLGAERIGLAVQGERLAGAIAAAGPEIGLGELQRMVRILSGHDRLTPTFRFEEGSTRLSPHSRSDLLQLAREIRDGHYAGNELMLAGFSDGRGPAMANRDLSSARAEAVRRELVSLLRGELPDDVTVTTEAFGEALPIACDEVDWGRNLNRRVELWIRRRGG